MNIAEIESQLKELVEAPFDPETFVFGFIEIYLAPKATRGQVRDPDPSLLRRRQARHRDQ